MLYTGNYKNHQMITWLINLNCNFNCSYCHQQAQNKTLTPINISLLSDGLTTLGKDWVFLLTGGEPFLEPNFIEICREITKDHFLAINTNLSTENIFEFGEQVDPKKTIFINAAVHIKEREKTDEKLQAYIEKMRYLQDRGFHMIAYYVAHPNILHRMKSDVDYLKYSGIKNVRLKIFRGVYQGIYYPAAFTDEQKDFIRTFEADWPEFELLNEIPSFKSKLCHAGRRFFVMHRNGDLRRCSQIYEKYGNLFKKKVNFDSDPKPCPTSFCSSTYEGIRNTGSETGKVNFLDNLMLVNKYQRLKRVITDPKRILQLKDKIIEYKSHPK